MLGIPAEKGRGYQAIKRPRVTISWELAAGDVVGFECGQMRKLHHGVGTIP